MLHPDSGGSTDTPVNPPSSSTYTDTEKFNAIIDQCLADITSYDAQTSNLSTALTNKKGNCLTLSEYVQIACDYLGIPCETLYGCTATDSYNSHIWNRVTLDGEVYWSDLTSAMYMNNRSYAKTKTATMNITNYDDYVYRLYADGSYKQYPSLSLTSQAGTVTNTCSYASMTANVVKTEYSKCKAQIEAKFTEYK